jgi:hypothetical protein
MGDASAKARYLDFIRTRSRHASVRISIDVGANGQHETAFLLVAHYTRRPKPWMSGPPHLGDDGIHGPTLMANLTH